MKMFRAIIAGVLIWAASSTVAMAQCGTSAPANKFCGGGPSGGLAGWLTIPAGALTPIAGGTVLANPTAALAVPVATAAPVLGIPGTSTGQIGLAGATSGTAILKAQPAAGSAISLLPTVAGTLVGSSASPLAINGTTGAISITGLAGGVLAGSGPAFTVTPVLGVPGASQGSLGFAGLTSGTVTVAAQSVAGTVALTLPNTSGTVAANATTPLVLSATTGTLTCPTCVTSSGGGAITGTAPIAVSAAGVVSINAPYVSLTASNGGIVYSGSTNLAILAGTATARQMLQSGASTTPAWSTTTWPATSTINRILFSSAANVIGEISTTNGGVLNANSSGVPSMTVTPVLGVPGISTGTMGFAGITSGTATITAQSAAGTPTLTLPNASGTFAIGASAPLVLSATTGNLTCPTCLTANQTITLSGDVSGSGATSISTTLASVASAGTTGSSTAIPVITINAKGLTTSIATAAVVAPAGTLTGATLASGVTASSLISGGASFSIGNATPTFASDFNVTSNGSVTGGDWIATFERQGNAANNESLIRHIAHSNFASTAAIPQPIIAGFGDRGTIASPVGLLSGDYLMILDGRGFDTSIFSDTAAQVALSAAGTWSAISHPSQIDFSTVAAGSISPVNRMRIDSAGGIDIPFNVIGGGCGVGCLNANAIQVAGVAVLTKSKQAWGGGCGQSGVSQNTTVYCPGTGNGAAAALTAAMVMSFSGTAKNLYAVSNTNAGVGQSWTLTMMKNGSAQSATCTISGGSSTSCNDTSNSFTFVAGDYISLRVVASATATNNATVNFGVELDNP